MSVSTIPVRGGGRFIATIKSIAQNWNDGHGPATYEIAVIEPINGTDRERRLAMRWHNSGNSGLGFPNTFGRPSWFEIEPTLETAMLAGLRLSAKEFAEALEYLSGKRG